MRRYIHFWDWNLKICCAFAALEHLPWENTCQEESPVEGGTEAGGRTGKQAPGHPPRPAQAAAQLAAQPQPCERRWLRTIPLSCSKLPLESVR